jgi:Amt family ammonium transporter
MARLITRVLLYGGDLFGPQFIGMAIVVTYSFVVSFIIFKFIDFILPLRVSVEEEEMGLDASQHDENYVQGTLLVKNSD